MHSVKKTNSNFVMDELVLQVMREEMQRQMSTFVNELLVNTFKYGTLADLNGGSLVQTHAEITSSGLSKPVLKTKMSQVSNMKKGEKMFIPCEKNIKLTERQKMQGYNMLDVSVGRWRQVVGDVTYKSGHRFIVNVDRENNGTLITRIK